MAGAGKLATRTSSLEETGDRDGRRLGLGLKVFTFGQKGVEAAAGFTPQIVSCQE